MQLILITFFLRFLYLVKFVDLVKGSNFECGTFSASVVEKVYNGEVAGRYEFPWFVLFSDFNL